MKETSNRGRLGADEVSPTPGLSDSVGIRKSIASVLSEALRQGRDPDPSGREATDRVPARLVGNDETTNEGNLNLKILCLGVRLTRRKPIHGVEEILPRYLL
jgi:hypothetical protein